MSRDPVPGNSGIKGILAGPFRQVIPLMGLPPKGPLSDSALHVIEEGGIFFHGERIARIGRFADLYAECDRRNTGLQEVAGDHVLLPGFIDAHSHICFGGSRAHDYSLRLQGLSYQEIASRGGGIWTTVTATRNMPLPELTAITAHRAGVMLSGGITTAEVKSGYGLEPDSELDMLRAIRSAGAAQPVSLIPTCLAAHVLPRDYAGDSSEYLRYIAGVLLPAISRENLCDRVDIFVEKGAFNPAESCEYLGEGRKQGFDLTVHADQFHTGGSRLAVEMDACSADHLEASGAAEIGMLARSNTVATVLPGSSLGLGIPFAPARKLLDAGACLAIASDWNPGSAPMGDLLTGAALLGIYEKLSCAEMLAGITFRAARALSLQDRGILSEGLSGDAVAFPCSDFREIFYHQGSMKPVKVWKKGALVYGDV